jgi:ADP-ribosyl-[dinitrogen reductase] hydrolase
MSAQLRDGVIGMLLGIRIGDALGMPLETLIPSFIKENLGKVTTYLPAPASHTIPNLPAGTATDDTQLTLAVARAFIEARGHFDLDEIARQHVIELERDHRTWGPTTRIAVKRLAQGTHWSESGKGLRPGSGKGNGVAMKCAPLAPYWMMVLKLYKSVPWEIIVEWERKVGNFAFMTHYTSLASSSCGAHIAAVRNCLESDPAQFRGDYFLLSVEVGAIHGLEHHELEDEQDNTLIHAIKKLRKSRELTDDFLQKEFGKDPFLVQNSLGMSYGCFARNPTSIDALYDVVNAGGDADSNGAFVGGLLGAFNGPGIFPKHLVDGCGDLSEVMSIAEQFCDCLGIK